VTYDITFPSINNITNSIHTKTTTFKMFIFEKRCNLQV
jgi:hypothetical protein